jgi:feruloyl-CoA synthase
MVQDAVVAGLNRDHIGLLVFPADRGHPARFGLPADDSAAQVLAAPAVRAAFQALMDRLWPRAPAVPRARQRR